MITVTMMTSLWEWPKYLYPVDRYLSNRYFFNVLNLQLIKSNDGAIGLNKRSWMRVHPCSLTPRLMSVAIRMFTIPIIHSKYGIASYAADSSNYTVPLIEGGLFRFRTYCCLHERKKAVSHVFFIYFGANCLKA